MRKTWKDRLELPKDVTERREILRIMGNREIYVSNYEKILCCTCECIRFRCSKRTMEVSGKNLEIPYYTKDQMQIVGHITGIRFE